MYTFAHACTWISAQVTCMYMIKLIWCKCKFPHKLFWSPIICTMESVVLTWVSEIAGFVLTTTTTALNALWIHYKVFFWRLVKLLKWSWMDWLIDIVLEDLIPDIIPWGSDLGYNNIYVMYSFSWSLWTWDIILTISDITMSYLLQLTRPELCFRTQRTTTSTQTLSRQVTWEWILEMAVAPSPSKI